MWGYTFGMELPESEKLEVLQAALDKYIREQRECGNPARRRDVVEFCQLKNMPIGDELARVGHLL
jgi:hypothetical protein